MDTEELIERLCDLVSLQAEIIKSQHALLAQYESCDKLEVMITQVTEEYQALTGNKD